VKGLERGPGTNQEKDQKKKKLKNKIMSMQLKIEMNIERKAKLKVLIIIVVLLTPNLKSHGFVHMYIESIMQGESAKIVILIITIRYFIVNINFKGANDKKEKI
jgi:hypothetical protein